MRRVLGLTVLALGLAGPAGAGDLQLSGGKHWLVLASDKDKNVAIGIARVVHNSLDDTRVVLSKNGFYGVIAGPYEANSIQELTASHKNGRFESLPRDALLSLGANYTETVWTPEPAADGAQQPYSLAKTASFSAGSFQATVTGAKLGAENAFTVIDGKDSTGAFHFDLGKDAKPDDQMTAEAMAADGFNNAAAVKLLAKADEPQLVITNFTGGAHCCVDTTLLARAPGAAAWAATKGAMLDGGGYWFEDVDGDGGRELMSADNAFLYAFASYAESNAPLRIEKFDGSKLTDVSNEAAMRPRLAQDLAGMEYSAKVQPELWKSNGFLAGWVADKIRMGQGDQAWARFMVNYDAHSDFGPQSCETGQSVEQCPADKLKPIPIPKALAQFLKDNGYLPLPQAAQSLLN